MGLFSELDCSIEQEFCKAQEEEDSKQVRWGEQRPGLNNPNPLQGSGGSGQLSGAIISHATIKAPSTTWTFNRLRDLSAHCVHMLIDAGVFVFTRSSTFSSKVESHDAALALQLPPKCSSAALSAVPDRPRSWPHVSGKEIVFYTCNFKQPLVSQSWSPISSQDATFVAEMKGLPTNPLTSAEKSSHH